MILLLTSVGAVLALWAVARAVRKHPVMAANHLQAPGPDSLYFEMTTGTIVAAGARVSNLLGYGSARDCLEQFNQAKHFKNASLVQLVSGQLAAGQLVLQDVQGHALTDDLRVEVFQGATGFEVQAAVKAERRASAVKPSSGESFAAPDRHSMLPAELAALFSVLAASHAGEPVATYHALFDPVTARLQPSPELCLRMGFRATNRGLTAALWRRCLVPGVYEDLLRYLKQQPLDEPILCPVSTVTGELLCLRVMVLTLPEPWASAYGGASGNRRTCLLKIQVGPHWDQAGALSAPDTVAQRSNDAVIEMAPDGVASEHGSADTASDAKRLTRVESDDAGVNVLKAASGSAGRLLLIEDNEMMRSALLPMLLEAGLRVTTAASLREAIHCWQPGRFDLVITDRNLGEDSILPLLDKMAAVGSLHPVLLITADPFEHPAVYATLAKPFALAAFQPFLDAGIKAMHSMKAETRRLKGFTP